VHIGWGSGLMMGFHIISIRHYTILVPIASYVLTFLTTMLEQLNVVFHTHRLDLEPDMVVRIS
jgi:cation transporter-like permease